MNPTRTYSDLDAAFIMNPGTRDLSIRTDESAVKFAVKNLILTMNFERPFDSTIGSQVKTLLFEPFTDITKIILKKVILNTLINHEPRIEVLNVQVIDNIDLNSVDINIIFKIINTNKPLSITVALDRTR